MSSKMPVLFISHSSPMLALDAVMGADYRRWAEILPKPEAILAFSAHWEGTQFHFGETGMHSELVYDFYGFPDELYRVQYPAPGAAWLADVVSDLLEQEIDRTDRGLDHGVWVPLLHMWPAADIPILQMSMPRTLSNQALFDLGRRLAPLRERAVMICSSGTLTHNLREGLSAAYSEPPLWVTDFDTWVAQSLTHNRTSLLNWETEAPQARRNHPTPEHFRPLLIAVGAAGEDESATFPIAGFEMQVFSRRAIQFG